MTAEPTPDEILGDALKHALETDTTERARLQAFAMQVIALTEPLTEPGMAADVVLREELIVDVRARHTLHTMALFALHGQVPLPALASGVPSEVEQGDLG